MQKKLRAANECGKSCGKGSTNQDGDVFLDAFRVPVGSSGGPAIVHAYAQVLALHKRYAGKVVA